MMYKLNRWLKIIQKLQPAERCLLCSGICRRGLCVECQAELPFQGHLVCPGCALTLASGKLCGACQTRQPSYAGAIALFRYESPVDFLIQRLKFQHDLAVARSLGHLMAEYLLANVSLRPQVIVPVPLASKRLQQRGFNQALELARPIAKRLQLPLDFRSCRRQRDTSPQVQLPRRQRQRNIRGAFICPQLAYRHVAVVDDVMTSAATVEEFSRSLQACGVERVDIWVCARAQ